MKPVVFLGPTMRVEDAEAILPAVYLPPVSRGDVYAAARSNPWAIAIVDGYFHRVPSVLHKEILWAMSRGVHVYGASSMGALRAAELDRFGMVGVGRVFEAYRDGTLTDDDEVAVAHGPPEAGFIAGSDAMVNIRETLAAARREGIIDAGVEARLLALAKDTFYPKRTWARLLALACEAAVSPAQCRALEAWLPHGRVDQKRLDADELLHRLAAGPEAPPGPKKVSFRFHGTFMWEELQNTIERRAPASRGAAQVMEEELLDELRLQGSGYARERARAHTRILAAELGAARAEGADAAEVERTAAALRERHGVQDQASFECWLEREGLTDASFADLMQEETLVESLETRYRGWIATYLRDSLRVDGRYGDVATRAWDKHDLLSRAGLDSPSLADAGLIEPELWRWYFETLLGTAVPADLEGYAATHDFPGVDLMRRAVLREFLYLRKTARRGGMAQVAASRD